MDLETENKIAAILMKEAELWLQAEKEGVLAYLRQPKAMFRPNSQFLSATVLGVQQENRAVEVNEMWRVRKNELELDDRLEGKMNDGSRNDRSRGDSNSMRYSSKRHAVTNDNSSPTCSSKRVYESCHSSKENGLKDEELEDFLH